MSKPEEIPNVYLEDMKMKSQSTMESNINNKE